MDFGITIPFINPCSLELCHSASLWVAVHWHHGLWHHSSFYKLCSWQLCYSASLRVAVDWLTSLYLHLSMDFTFTLTIGLCSFTESFRPCHSPPWLSWLLTWLRSIIWRRFLSMSMKVSKTWLQELVSIPLLASLTDFDLFSIDGSGLEEDWAMKDVSTTTAETLLTWCCSIFTLQFMNTLRVTWNFAIVSLSTLDSLDCIDDIHDSIWPWVTGSWLSSRVFALAPLAWAFVIARFADVAAVLALPLRAFCSSDSLWRLGSVIRLHVYHSWSYSLFWIGRRLYHFAS